VSWTYTGQPFAEAPEGEVPTAQQNRDTVRFLIGDTMPSDPQLQDGEIDGLIYTTRSSSSGTGTQVGATTVDLYQAAIAAVVALAGIYTRKANKSVGDLSVQSAAIADNYRKLRSDLMSQAARHSVPIPYAGAISVADKEIDASDTDIPAWDFTIGMDDNPYRAPDFNNGGGFTQVVPD
jgi:hypothetical protein